MPLGNVFYEFALLLAAAGVLGFIAHWLKQPLIVAFIAVGILVGPAGLKWVSIGSEIDLTLTLLFLAVVLLASMIAGLVRVMLGPTPSDRMLAAQLMGTTGVGILLLLAEATLRPALLDVALVFALLSAVAGIAFVQRYDTYEAGTER